MTCFIIVFIVFFIKIQSNLLKHLLSETLACWRYTVWIYRDLFFAQLRFLMRLLQLKFKCLFLLLIRLHFIQIALNFFIFRLIIIVWRVWCFIVILFLIFFWKVEIILILILILVFKFFTIFFILIVFIIQMNFRKLLIICLASSLFIQKVWIYFTIVIRL